MFNYEEFEYLLAQYESGNVMGWEHMTDTNGLKLYKKEREGTNLHEYMVIGHLDGMDCETAYHVYMDLEYRREWDGYKKEQLYLINGATQSSAISNINRGQDDNLTEKPQTGFDTIYWKMKYPLMMADRIYRFNRATREMFDSHGQACYLVLCKNDSAHPDAQDGMMRVNQYESGIVFSPGQNPLEQTSVFMNYFHDPQLGDNIPKPLLNFVIQVGIPSFIKKFKEACKNYKTNGAPVTSEKGVQELKETLDKSLANAFVLGY